MVDQNTFINTYIDTIINQLLENVKSNLQLQTQVKVGEFVVAEKDKAIALLTQQLEENKVAEDWKTKYEGAEVNYNAVLGKLKHMEVLLNQVSDMKKQIIERDETISNLKQELDDIKNPKKVINTKTKKKIEEQPKSTDDF